MPTVPQFQAGIYVSAAYAGGGATAPILRAPSGTAMNLGNLGAQGTHFSLSFPPALPAPRPAASPATTPYLSEGALLFDGPTGGQRVPFAPPGVGTNVAYLPFVQRMITSVILPADPASNVDFFYTDNLSGCMIFIDQVAGTNDLVVYHANREDLTSVPGGLAGLSAYEASTPFASRFQPARNMMRTHHRTAQADISAAMGGVALNNVAELWRADYFLCVENEKARKTAQRRANVDIGAAGTNVMGFRVAGTWQFWWQTWGILTYDRPIPSTKMFREPHKGLVAGTGRLLAAQRFH